VNVQDDFLKSAARQFKMYRGIGEKAMAQVSDAALFHQFNEESNSIAIIVKHLHGNMLSRWTDFLTSDGEKEWRDRDGEFENSLKTREEVMKIWNEGWGCLEKTLESLHGADVEKQVVIRSESHSVLEAINRQIAHYAYHVGQIVYASKILVQSEWHSMSIPKNKSREFNDKMFGKKA